MHKEIFYKNKVVVVTGASKGIGKSLVYLLVASGAKVAGLARSVELLDAITLKTEKLSGTFLPIDCDVSDRNEVKSAIEIIRSKFEKIDILINNAGVGLTGPSYQTDRREIVKCFDVNFFGALNCIEPVLPEMLERQQGTIVNIASIVAKYGLPANSYYSAAKAALVSYTQALRAEVAPANINVLTIYPGSTDTEFQKDQSKTPGFIPNKPNKSRQLSSNLAAKKILFAIEKNKREFIISRTTKMMIFLKTFFPFVAEYIVIKIFGTEKWHSQKKL